MALLLCACAVHAPRPPEGKEERPSEFPAAFYRQLAEQGSPVFEIDPATSLVVIEARRGGSLARLGHDHVIASHGVRGYVAPSRARADLYIRLDELIVDETPLRLKAGFDTQPTEAAIAGTRTNMLSQLHAEQHPYALISVASVDTAGERALDTSISVNGIARRLKIPAKIEQSAEEVAVTGTVALEQSSFGIAPLSILGGGIQVLDRVDVSFVIHAHRIAP